MFNIRYKILEDEDIESYELKGEYGYFEFQTNDEVYGIYIDEILDIFSVSIYWWFYYFLNSLLLLNKTNYVLISDIEKADVWIELKKENEKIYISKVCADKPEGTSALETTLMPTLEYKYWKNQEVAFSNFCEEIIQESKKYLNDLKTLNTEKQKDMQNLELLIKKVEKEL